MLSRRAYYYYYLLLILNTLHLVRASQKKLYNIVEPIRFNLTTPINQILRHGDAQQKELLKKLEPMPRYLYSTVLDNETVLLELYNVAHLMNEIVPGSSRWLHVQLGQGKNKVSLDLDSIKSSGVGWTKQSNNKTGDDLESRTREIIAFVTWENTGCAHELAQHIRKTFETLTALEELLVDIKIYTGVAYTSKDIGCPHLLEIIAEHSSVRLMLTIDFHVDEGTHHVQHIFNAFVSDTLRANEEFISGADNNNNNRGIISPLVYPSLRLLPSGGSKKRVVTHRDHVLFHKFADSWEPKRGREFSISNTFNFNLDLNPGLVDMIVFEGGSSYPKNLIVPFVGARRGTDSHQFNNVPALLCEVAEKFDGVEVDTKIWNLLSEIDPIICATKNTSDDGSPLKLNVYHVAQRNESLSGQANNKHSSSSNLISPPTQTIRSTSVLLQHPKYSKNTSSPDGCHIQFGNLPDKTDEAHPEFINSLVNLTIRECSALLPLNDFPTYVLWEFDFAKSGLERRLTNNEPNYYTTSFLPRLSAISSQIENFVKMYPGTQLLALKFTLEQPRGYNIACDDRHSKSRQIFLFLLNWAYLNNVSLFLNTRADVGFADVLLKNSQATLPELHAVATRWPEFVSRHHPSNLDGFYPWNDQDLCVEDYPAKFSPPIHFDEFGGASLNMTLRDSSSSSPPLSSREVQTLLQFAFHKFSNLEIVVGEGAEDGATLAEALSPEFLKYLEGVGDHKVVYILIPSAQLLLHQEDVQLVVHSIRSSFKNVQNISLGGVHVRSSPEIGELGRNVEALKGIVSMMSGGVLRVGLYSNQCDQFVAALLNSSTSKQQVHEPFLNRIDYLVCSMSSLRPPPHYRFGDDYVDAHLYILRAMSRRYPALRLYFKLYEDRFLSSRYSSPREYVEQMNHSVYIATSLKINCFVAKVASDSSRAELGWWNITDYKDLTDTNVYRELEAVVLGQQTWTPTPFQDDDAREAVQVTTFFQKWSTYVTVGPIGAVLLITLISLTVWNFVLRGRVGVLSKQEMYEFRNGGGGGVPLLGSGMELDLCSTMRYDSSYEISKQELNLDSATLLGMGNFGQVRQASVKGNLAAIKSPHDNCSKESFKSMLIEVKVMCHLGTHPNLVELVGCHTSEIGRGMIYIVTALCEHGSLLSCIKNNGVVVQFQDMVKFAHEIACGMDYIAGKNVVHGDLATRNVLLDSHNICKIGDFGLSRKLYEYSMYVKQSQEPLPWRWMAYESFFKMEFTSMSDVWSCGVTLWEIFNLGAVPYPGVQWRHGFVEELKSGLRMKSPEFATPEIYSEMLKCWNLDPKARPTFEELVQFFIPFRDAEYQDLGD